MKVGDRIVALTATGIPTFDTVSFFSTARRDDEGAFVQLTLTQVNEGSQAEMTLTLTPEHHLPAGEICCENVKKAKNLSAGESVFGIFELSTAQSQFDLGDDLAVEPLKVIGMKTVTSKGFHSPVLTNGSNPFIDGVVTSYDTPKRVYWSLSALAYAEPLCWATITHNS